MIYVEVYFFFFKQKTAYEMRISDWSSDLCSSDLKRPSPRRPPPSRPRTSPRHPPPRPSPRPPPRASASSTPEPSPDRHGGGVGRTPFPARIHFTRYEELTQWPRSPQTGRAAGRERGCQYV